MNEEHERAVAAAKERESRNEANDAAGLGPIRGLRGGRKPSNPGLTTLAYKLESVEFLYPLAENEADQVEANMGQSHKGISILPSSGGPLWTVRASCLGVPVILGMAHGGTIEHQSKMLRYADMCRVRFWQYRLRDRRPPKAGELNLSVARAEMDLKNETQVVALLDEIEHYMISTGIVKSAAETTAEIKELQKNRMKKAAGRQANMEALLKQLVSTQEARLDGMQSMIQSLMKDNQVLMTAIGSLLQRPQVVTGVWSGSEPQPPQITPMYRPPQTGDPLPPTGTVWCKS